MFQKKSGKSALILRFSSFGDIVQVSFAADSLCKKSYLVDLVTKKEFTHAFENKDFPFREVFSYDKSKPHALWDLAKQVHKKNYSLIYDAHNNQRTFLFKIFLVLLNPLNFFKFKTRSKFRFKRLLLFKFRIDTFPKPFKGAASFLKPLQLNLSPLEQKQAALTKEILLAPSAAWDLKKWPEAYWVTLAQELVNTQFKVSFIGGPSDNFIDDIAKQVPESINLSGKLSWAETISLVQSSSLLISGDTGVLHIADYFQVNAIGLMGPSAFGRPSRKSSQVLYKNLNCQPCSKDGRGKCKNPVFKKCLVSISPEEVFKLAETTLLTSSPSHPHTNEAP